MRLHAGAVTLVAAGEKPFRAGMTATAVCSVSDSPPTLLVCVNRTAKIRAIIQSVRCFAVSLLAEHHTALANRFAGREGVDGEERFLAGSWTTLSTGCPVLDDALAAIDCKLVEIKEIATHTIFIGSVEAIRIGEGRPLVYYLAGFHRLMTS